MKSIALAALLALSACATLTKDNHSEQAITVATNPPGAHCSLSNQRGQWDIAPTPGTANVKRSFSPLTIQCAQAGLQASRTLEPKTRGRAYGNILLGGVPAFVDAGTGAGYEYFEDEVTLELK